jgi:hypothetical protein
LNHKRPPTHPRPTHSPTHLHHSLPLAPAVLKVAGRVRRPFVQ